MQNQVHIQTTRATTANPFITDTCVMCGAKSETHERSGVLARQINRDYFAKLHTECGRVYNEQTALETAAVQDDDTATAFRQLYAAASMMDEETGSRTMTALAKAIDEIDLNPSIKFVGNVLCFKSLRSGKDRVVTVHGCYKTCDCKGEISYHSQIYAILERRDQIKRYNAVEVIAVQTIQPAAQQSKNGVITESCGCCFDWDSKFYESFCADHKFTADAGEAAAYFYA